MGAVPTLPVPAVGAGATRPEVVLQPRQPALERGNHDLVTARNGDEVTTASHNRNKKRKKDRPSWDGGGGEGGESVA